MKNEKVSKKLSLKKFTISQLNNPTMGVIKGGVIYQDPSMAVPLTDGICDSGKTFGGPGCPVVVTEPPVCVDVVTSSCAQEETRLCPFSEINSCSI